MKCLVTGLIFLFIVGTISSPVFGQSRGTPTPTPTPRPPFVESNVPEGKSLVYIYYVGWSLENLGPLILTKSGPLGVLIHGSYFSYVAEPGTVKLWLVASLAKGIKFETLAGQICYVRADILYGGTPDLKLISNDKAKTEMAGYEKLDE